jgi:hypothetical protein
MEQKLKERDSPLSPEAQLYIQHHIAKLKEKISEFCSQMIDKAPAKNPEQAATITVDDVKNLFSELEVFRKQNIQEALQ